MEINNLFLNEHHIYSPDELYFSVDNSGLEDFSGVKYVVYFTTIDCFEITLPSTFVDLTETLCMYNGLFLGRHIFGTNLSFYHSS
jgi:hypothetical protein